MKMKIKGTYAALAVVGVAGLVWFGSQGKDLLPAAFKGAPASDTPAPSATPVPVVVTANGQTVRMEKPVTVKTGQVVTLALTSHEGTDVKVTVPGVQDTPVTVPPGGTNQLQVTIKTPGTYPIMEEGTMQNTRSVEGGTTGYDLEVGVIEVSGD
jgi:hypothetical protein